MQVPTKMTLLGISGEQLMLLQKLPRINNNLNGHPKKSPEVLVFGGSWVELPKLGLSHHSLPLFIDGAGQKCFKHLVAIDARAAEKLLE